MSLRHTKLLTKQLYLGGRNLEYCKSFELVNPLCKSSGFGVNCEYMYVIFIYIHITHIRPYYQYYSTSEYHIYIQPASPLTGHVCIITILINQEINKFILLHVFCTSLKITNHVDACGELHVCHGFPYLNLDLISGMWSTIRLQYYVVSKLHFLKIKIESLKLIIKI